MSDMDDKVNAAYRALGREEPPSALDARILAASREALVRRSPSQRWAAPVSIAAVLVLALGVTLRMQQEQPGIESPDMDATRPQQRQAAPAAPPAAAPADAVTSKDSVAERFDEKLAATPAKPMQQRAAPAEEARAKKKAVMQDSAVVQQPVPEAKRDRSEADFRDQPRAESERKDLGVRNSASSLAKEANVAAEPPAVAAAAAPSPQPKLQSAPAAQSITQGATPPPPAAARAFAPEPPARLKREANVAADAQAIDEPTRELEAIAKLRAEGRHEDADKALAEFRRKRPDYRIADAMWERVKPR